MAWRDDVRQALENIGGIGSLSQIYSAVRAIRNQNNQSLPKTYDAIVRRELEYNSSDSESYKKRFNLFYSAKGIGNGVWGLRSAIAGELASDLQESYRVETTTYRILRDTKLARQIKRFHKDRCNICSQTVELSEGKTYSEGHHIRPLGSPHNGPDIAGNILVLCPTCHVRCDYFAVKLDKASLLMVDGHDISQEFIDYHNDWYVRGLKT